jgi:hypothetical protein
MMLLGKRANRFLTHTMVIEPVCISGDFFSSSLAHFYAALHLTEREEPCILLIYMLLKSLYDFAFCLSSLRLKTLEPKTRGRRITDIGLQGVRWWCPVTVDYGVSPFTQFLPQRGSYPGIGHMQLVIHKYSHILYNRVQPFESTVYGPFTMPHRLFIHCGGHCPCGIP